MANVTISVPEDLKKKMDETGIINWSEVARLAFKQQLQELELVQELTKDSKATEEGIERISKKIKHGIAKRHGL